MTKVLLTGATGFIGSYVCRYLVRHGFEITATIRSTSPLDLLKDVEDKIELVKIDLEDLVLLSELVATADLIIHCAALLSITSDSDKEMYDFNIGSTADLVNLAIEHQIKKFIFISSVASLRGLKTNDLISEDNAGDLDEIKTAYGKSKSLAEREVFRGKAEGLNIIILHPSFVIGSGYWHTGTPSFINKIYSGVPFYPPGVNGTVDVRDVAIAVKSAIEYRGELDRFIISAENHSMKSIFDMTCDALGIKRVNVKLNHLLGWTGIIFDKFRSMTTGSKRLITVDILHTSSRKYQYDNRQSVHELGLEYRNIDETIKEVCNQYLESKHAKKNFAILDL